MSTKGNGWWFLGGMAIIIISLAAIAIGSTVKTGKKTTTLPKPQVVEENTKENYDTKILGIVKAIDEVQGTVTVYDTTADIDRTLTYTGGTRVLDRYGKERLMSWLTIGELVNAYYYQSSYKLTKIEVNKEAWEYSGISRFKFDMTNQQVTVAERQYYYETDLFVTGAGEELGLIDINAKDELMLKGIGSQVYSVIITKGHGYIRLKNYKAFLGGTIEVGYNIILPVTKDMLIAVREGSYKVKMENGELAGTKDVLIERNEEYILDMGEFKADEARIGKTVFMIDPQGAKLFINEIETDYSKKVKLNYGDYQIRVEMSGYTTFSGTLTIEEKNPVVCVSLSVDGADTSGTTDGVTITPSETEGTSSTNTSENDSTSSENSNTGNSETDSENTNSTTEDEKDSSSSSSSANTVGTTLIDEEHVITISSPEGAKVYWNGAYKGTVPVSFAKEIGNHTITFSRSGYLTRSYSCEIVDDNNDVTLNFPDMVKKETN